MYRFKIVGRGAADRTTVIDDVRVESLDALFAARLPAGGRSAGEESRLDFRAQQAVQAQFAQVYGLKVVAYEGGWSLGGDTQSVPIQSWAKYRDGRAADVMAAAIDIFYQAGGELNVLGTYDQWYLDDAANADAYPLIKGIDARIGGVPAVAGPGPGPSQPPKSNPPPAQGGGLPGGWAVDDVGDPDVGGGASFNNGRWTVRGAGRNIWGAADEFAFAHTAADGDVVLTARIDKQEQTHAWAKAGLMIRAGTGESVQFAGVFRTPDNGIVFETRKAYRATPDSVGVDVGNGPVWVRLIRRANSFAAYYSTDGNRWTRIGEAETINMPTSTRAGLAVTSHDAGQLGSATFSNVSVAG
jgi:regulation of enolase protein 1 (concanavalin A-like superfamily)